MKCLIYTRVSTDRQENTNQIDQLREFAEKSGWEIADIVMDVCSGGTAAEQRQGLSKVFSLANRKKFDVLLFWSLDRFSREGSRKTLEYLTRLDSYGVKWHSYTEQFISSCGIFADAIISIMAALARQEKIRIQERTKAGLERAKRKGKILGRPQIIEKEKILELRKQGLSMRKIAVELGVSAPRVCQVINAAE